MKQTLTEQWKNGELAGGIYYCKTKSFGVKKLWFHHKAHSGMYVQTYGQEECYPDEDIIEVLAPVPTYEEYQKLIFYSDDLDKTTDLLTETQDKWLKTIKANKKLKEQLAIAIKALEVLETKSDKFDDSWGIQEQLDFIKAKCQETLYHLKEKEDVK